MGKKTKKPSFNPMVLWDNMTQEQQKLMLKNVYCVKCRGMVEIKNYTFHPEGKSLMLRGICSKCGHEVARVLEGA
jgi:hypothetical protein